MKRVAIAVAALALTGCGPVQRQAKRCTSPANPYGAAPINWRYAKADAGQRARMMDLWHLRADDIDSILLGIEQARVKGRVAPKGCTIVFAGGVDRDSAAELAEAVFTN